MIFRLIEARPNKIRSQPAPIESLASRVFLEPACPGHEPRTMLLFGWRRHPLSEIRSRDDATLARSDDTELRLVSIGHFIKLVARLSARVIYILTNPFAILVN
jgi:hypothetical protein